MRDDHIEALETLGSLSSAVYIYISTCDRELLFPFLFSRVVANVSEIACCLNKPTTCEVVTSKLCSERGLAIHIYR